MGLLAACYLPNIKKLTIRKRVGSPVPNFASSQPTSITVQGDYEVLTYKNITIDNPGRQACPQLPSHINKIECRLCGEILLEKSISLGQLPSKYWMELVDCWSCHQSEFAVITQKLEYSENGQEILPKSGRLLNQGMFILASLSDLNSGHSGACECGAVLGEALKAVSSNAPTHLRLFRGEVNIYENLNALPLPEPMILMMTEFFDSYDAQGIRSFILTSLTSELRLYLKFLSWDLKILMDSKDKWLNACIVEVFQCNTDGGLIDEEVSILIWPESLILQFIKAVDSGKQLARDFGIGESSQLISILAY